MKKTTTVTEQETMTDVINNTIEINNGYGRIFTVRIVLRGDSYGRDGCLTHSGRDPLVEFYDKTYVEGHTPMGQFVSRYALSTLQERPNVGLNLHGGVDGWHVSADNVADAISYGEFGRSVQ